MKRKRKIVVKKQNGIVVKLQGEKEDIEFMKAMIVATNALCKATKCSTKDSLILIFSGYLAEEANRIEREN